MDEKTAKVLRESIEDKRNKLGRHCRCQNMALELLEKLLAAEAKVTTLEHQLRAEREDGKNQKCGEPWGPDKPNHYCTAPKGHAGPHPRFMQAGQDVQP